MENGKERNRRCVSFILLRISDVNGNNILRIFMTILKYLKVKLTEVVYAYASWS
jgi:hypothetical protein